jgi:hypothetical protein
MEVISPISFKLLREIYTNQERIVGIPLWFHETSFKKMYLGLELHKADINLVPLADASGFPLWYRWGLAHHISHAGHHSLYCLCLKTQDHLSTLLCLHLVNSPASIG